MTDDKIGTITGTATFERVAVISTEDGGIRVVGEYQDSKTTYKTHQDNVFIGGMSLDLIHDEFWLRPDGGWIYVEATETKLRITENDPNE